MKSLQSHGAPLTGEQEPHGVRLAEYSRDCLKALRDETGIRYSQAIVIDGWIHTSGQIPLTAAGEKVAGDIAAHTEQVFDNLQAVLAAGGSEFAKVVSVNVYMTDLGAFAQMNDVFARRFGGHRPARSTVQVAALPTGARVTPATGPSSPSISAPSATTGGR